MIANKKRINLFFVIFLFCNTNIFSQKIEYLLNISNSDFNVFKVDENVSIQSVDNNRPDFFQSVIGNQITKSHDYKFEFLPGIKIGNHEFYVGLSISKFKEVNVGYGLDSNFLYNYYNEGNSFKSSDFRRYGIYYNHYFSINKTELGIGLYCKMESLKNIIINASNGTSYSNLDRKQTVITTWDSTTSPNVFNYSIGCNPSFRLKITSFLKISSGVFTGFNLQMRKGYYRDIGFQYLNGVSDYPTNTKEYFNTKIYSFYYQPYLSLQFLLK